MQTVPAGYSIRRPTLDDGASTYEVVAVHNIPLIGEADFIPQDAIDELREPDFDLDKDGWLVFSEAGTPVGWARAHRKSTSNSAWLSIFRAPGHDEIASLLWDAAEARALEAVAEVGHGQAILDIGIYPEDKLMREIAERHGYAPAARFIRMRIKHPSPVPAPPVPEGVTIRHGTEGETVWRHSLELRNQAFHDHFGHVPAVYDEWVALRESSSMHDWALLHVAYLDGEPAATLVRTNHFVPEENCGYVQTLGTALEFRGRGLAGYLLRYAFAADSALGRDGTVLDVDSNPERPALGLYKRAGMHESTVIDDWRKLADI